MSAVMKERIPAASNDAGQPAAALLSRANFNPRQMENLGVIAIALRDGYISRDVVLSAADMGPKCDEVIIQMMRPEDYIDCLRELGRTTTEVRNTRIEA